MSKQFSKLMGLGYKFHILSQKLHFALFVILKAFLVKNNFHFEYKYYPPRFHNSHNIIETFYALYIFVCITCKMFARYKPVLCTHA